MSSKPTNPKDAVGIGKAPLSTLSAAVLLEVGTAMMEGARKYGRHNYRDAGVRASVYYDATLRHLLAWWDGQDTDPDSGLSHITKAIASLVVLRDAMINNMWDDDRPPAVQDWGPFLNKMNDRAAELLVRYPEPKEPFTEKGKVYKPVPPSGVFPNNSTIDPEAVAEAL